MTTPPIVVFRAASDIEARLVRGLLESHGFRTFVQSEQPTAMFPVAVGGMSEVAVAVSADQAADARRVLETHHDRVGLTAGPADPLAELERRIGYRFRDRGLLEHALTHRSRAHEDESGAATDNESLEFLGDAVLGFVIADLLYRELPESSEGLKSKIKASIVSAAVLADRAVHAGLGAHLLLGRGEERSGGRRKQALLADTYEAIIAAIYLDGGIAPARAFVSREFAARNGEARDTGTVTATSDDKSALQEWLQSRGRPIPEYRLARESGPDHRKRFLIDVVVEGIVLASAEGSSKKEAEQRAARLAIEVLAQAPMDPSPPAP